MKMGNSPIAESMVEIRNILNRIDGVNVPTNEINELADDDKIEFTKVMLDISQIKDRVEALSVDEEAKKSAIQSLTNAEEALVALDESAVREDSRTERRYTSDQIDQLKQWAKKYSQYKNIEGENLIEALYEYVFEMGIRQLAFEKGELQAAEKKIGKAQEDWEDAEIEAAIEMSPISSGLMDDLENIIPGDVELEKKLDTIRTMLQKAGLKEDPYQPFPEEDEMTFEDDDAFYEAFGELGFPEDETELFDAEYRGRKVPLNKPMRGDVKKFKVYVKDPKTGNVKKVNFGHGGSSARKAGQKTMKIRKSNPKARKSFRARHNCANPGPKTRARYWSCRAW
jgi:hypothetical protein